LNVLLCSLLIHSLALRGLTLSLSLTTAAEATIMMLFLRYRTGRVFSPGFFEWLMKVVLAGGAMAVVILTTVGPLNRVLESDTSIIVHLLYFAVCMSLYALTFAWAAWALRI